MADDHSPRAVACWAAYGVGTGAVLFAVLRFMSDNRTVVGVIVGLVVIASAIALWRRTASDEFRRWLRDPDSSGRRATLVFCCALAVSGTATAAALPDLTVPTGPVFARTAGQPRSHVGLAEQADEWLHALLAKAESTMPGSTDHIYSISFDNQSVVLLVYDPASYQLWGLSQTAKGQSHPTSSTVLDSVSARTFAFDAIKVASLTSVYQTVLATTKAYPATQDKLDVVSPVAGAPPVITVTLGYGTGAEQRVQADASGDIAVPFDPSGTFTAYKVATSLLASVGVSTAEPVISRLIMQSADDGTRPLGDSPISDTGGILLEITKAGPDGRPATIYQAPGAFPVVEYHDASTTPADALFALDDFAAEPLRYAIDDCAKRVGGNDSDMRTVALELGMTTVNGQSRIAVQIQLGTRPNSYAIYDTGGQILQVGP